MIPIGKQRIPRRRLPGPGSAARAWGGGGPRSRGGGALSSGGFTRGDPRLGGEGPAEKETNKEITRPRSPPGSAYPPPRRLPHPSGPGGGAPAPLPHVAPQPGSPRVSGATGVTSPSPQDRAAGDPRNPPNPAPAQPLPAAAAPPPRAGTGSGTEARGSPCPAGADGRPPRPGVPGSPPPTPLAARWAPFRRSLQRGKTRRRSGGDASGGGSGRGRRHPSSSRPESPQIEAVGMTVD